GWSAGGGGGGAGIVPVTLRCCATTSSGTSVTFVAVTFMPFCRPQASVICPLTSNFWPFGILNRWFLPSSNVRITEVGGLTYHTVPVTLCTVWIILGVVVVVMVRCNFIPGFKSCIPSCFPSTVMRALLGILSK